jgi:hypothetical protein
MVSRVKDIMAVLLVLIQEVVVLVSLETVIMAAVVSL